MGIVNHTWGVSVGADRVWGHVCGLPPSISARRQLMVYQAYIDDSRRDGKTFTLAGFIASAATWASFAEQWEQLLPYAVRKKDGKFHFKMSEMAISPERFGRVLPFLRVIEEFDLVGLAVSFAPEDIFEAQKLIWTSSGVIDWHQWNNPYIFAFHSIMQSFHAHKEKFGNKIPEGERVDFIFDEQAEKSIILPAWDDYMSGMDSEFRGRFGSTPRFVDDTEFLPLQAADFLAWWVDKWRSEGTTVRDNRIEGRIKFGNMLCNRKISMIQFTVDRDNAVDILLGVARQRVPFPFLIHDLRSARP